MSDSVKINAQSRKESMVEVVLSTTVGYLVALLGQWRIFPQFGIHVSSSTHLWIGAWFTLVSLLRGYVIRRWFNARLKKAAARIAHVL